MDATPDYLRMDRRRSICAGLLVAQGVYTLATLYLIPSLVGTKPVLLELLRGSTAALVAGGAFARVGRASLALALLAPLPTLMITGPILWWAGRLWGPGIVELIFGQGAHERRGVKRALRVVERGRAWGIVLGYLLPIPTAIIYAAAGWTGMSFVRFIVLDLIGTLLWVGLIVGLGYGLGHSAVNVAHEISHYGLYVTIGLVVLTVAVTIWRTPRTAPDDGDPPLSE